MNQRIKELAEQAKSSDGWLFDTDKFAELIVLECADFLKDKLDDHFAAEQLVEHFGVKND